jgi:hypothetical protein
LKQAQQLLGHSDMRTTLRYAGHFYDNVSRKTIANGFSSFAALATEKLAAGDLVEVYNQEQLQ